MAEAGDVRASLFVTCLVDQFFPQVGESVVAVLRRLGVTVNFPWGQTCCGQPAFNSGFRGEARAVARRVLELFEGNQYVVVPSGSCASMVRVFYPELFQDEPALARAARELAGRVYEFSEFLVKVVGVTDVGAASSGRVTYHPSCHLVRELGVVQEPLQLIAKVRGIEFVPLRGDVPCCGFGGSFAVKMASISEAMLEEKLREIEGSAPDVVVSCDMSCLMHIGGALARRRPRVRVMHLAQLLAGQGEPWR
ncbi:MAG: (Fe-S)-binding protein [Dehalococcoidia bacterium]